MAKISKNNIYAIKYLYSQGMGVGDIAKELNLSEENIIPITADLDRAEPATKTVSSKDLMITKTSAKNNNSVAIMTKEASMKNDYDKTNRKPQISNKESHIFKPLQ